MAPGRPSTIGLSLPSLLPASLKLWLLVKKGSRERRAAAIRLDRPTVDIASIIANYPCVAPVTIATRPFSACVNASLQQIAHDGAGRPPVSADRARVCASDNCCCTCRRIGKRIFAGGTFNHQRHRQSVDRERRFGGCDDGG